MLLSFDPKSELSSFEKSPEIPGHKPTCLDGVKRCMRLACCHLLATGVPTRLKSNEHCKGNIIFPKPRFVAWRRPRIRSWGEDSICITPLAARLGSIYKRTHRLCGTVYFVLHFIASLSPWAGVPQLTCSEIPKLDNTHYRYFR